MNRQRGLMCGRAMNYRLGLAVAFSAWIFASGGVAHGQDGEDPVAVKPARDPFWPVGYKAQKGAPQAEVAPPQAVSQKSDEDWRAAMKQVMVSGVSRRGESEYCAVINGELKVVGEKITVSYNGAEFSWTVAAIAPPASIKLRRVSK